MGNTTFEELLSIQDRIDNLFKTSILNLESFLENDEVSKALWKINRAMYLCEEIGDKNRQAIANMITGLVYYRLDKFDKALGYHREAERIWKNECDNGYSTEHEADNYIHMLKAMVNNNIMRSDRVNIAVKCAKNDSWMIKVRSWLINLPYGIGVIIDDRIQDFVGYPQFH